VLHPARPARVGWITACGSSQFNWIAARHNLSTLYALRSKSSRQQFPNPVCRTA
jgi:hypothetical protein